MRQRVSIITLIVVMAMALVVSLLLFLEKPTNDESSEYMSYCLEIYDAIHTFDENEGVFPRDTETIPPGGTSWRLLLHKSMYPSRERDLQPLSPWNSPPNNTYDYLVGPPFAVSKSFAPSVVAIRGKDSPWEKSSTYRLSELPSALILFVRCEGVDGHWMQPIDWTPEQFLKGQLSPKSQRSNIVVVFADGMIVEIKANAPLEEFVRLMNKDSANARLRSELIGVWSVRQLDWHSWRMLRDRPRR